MSGILKVLNAILGILAVVVCLTTVGVIIYASVHPNMGGNAAPIAVATESPTAEAQAGEATDATATPESSGSTLAGHVHDYKETIDIQATCMSAGRMKYICSCGDFYYVEIPTAGHVADDWEVATEPTANQSGLRVKKCIYCDELIAREIIPATGAAASANHVHAYIASIESEPTCTVAGIKRYTCSCGSFYQQNISAIGHLAGDWTVIKEATISETGLKQKICNVCHTLIDSRSIDKLPPTPSPSTSPLPSGATPSPSPTPTAAPTPTPHSHSFVWYVYKDATCNEAGIKTGNCSCGAEDIEPIPINKDNHNYAITIIKPTATEKGYTQHVCTRCGDSFKDNETPATG